MEKDKAYIVKSDTGIYEDYLEYNQAIFLDKQKAEDYLQELEEYFKNQDYEVYVEETDVYEAHTKYLYDCADYRNSSPLKVKHYIDGGISFSLEEVELIK